MFLLVYHATVSVVIYLSLLEKDAATEALPWMIRQDILSADTDDIGEILKQKGSRCHEISGRQ